MSEFAISPQGTQKAMIQMIDVMAQLFSDKVSEKLKKSGLFPVQEIEVKTVTVENPDELLTIKDLEGIFKVKKGAIYDWRKKGVLKPDTYIGRSPRYKRGSISNFINSKKQ